MSLTIRGARTDDLSAAALLALHSFPSVGLNLDGWVQSLSGSPRGGLGTLRVAERDGQINAICRIYRFEQWIAGRPLPVMGLGTVAVSPVARRSGLARQLVIDSLCHARSSGELGAALYPFRTAFYQRLGFGIAGEALEYRIPPAALPDHPARQEVRLVDSDRSRAAVADVYDRWIQRQTGQLRRAKAVWELLWDGDRHGVLYRERLGTPAGYAIFHYTQGTSGRSAVAIDEFAALSTEARRGLYGWMGALRDQWPEIVYRAHPEENFAEYLSELRFASDPGGGWNLWYPSATLLRGPMFRILDVERAWRARTIRPGDAAKVALQVQDDEIAENNGAWTLQMNEGTIEVQRGQAERADLHLVLDIGTLSRIFIGALSISDAIAVGLISGGRTEAVSSIDAMLRLPCPWTFDRF